MNDCRFISPFLNAPHFRIQFYTVARYLRVYSSSLFTTAVNIGYMPPAIGKKCRAFIARHFAASELSLLKCVSLRKVQQFLPGGNIAKRLFT